MQKLKSYIDHYIQQEKKLCFEVHTIDSPVEKILEYTLRTILSQYHQEELIELVYTSVKELAINGSKANIKRVLFDEYNIDFSTEEGHLKGVNLFKDKVSEQFMIQYGEKARQQGLSVKIKMDYNKDRLIIIVLNNVPIFDAEDRIIRRKFKRAMEYDDIVQFYLEYGDDTEGAGLGITLVTMLFKNSSIDPHLFTIYSYEDVTRAKLEIPLSEEYIPTRIQYEMDHS